MSSVTVRAFAKINLSLRITSARPDGFHDVRTIFQSIDLFDRVTCEARRGRFEIRCDTPGVPTDGNNLVSQAAQLLWEAAGRAGEPRHALVTLQKNIPTQAGLGGGSSDAAAALLGLRRLWRLSVPDEQVYALAARLGSDVPFFLTGGTALGVGRGEEVYPLEDLPPYAVLLVIPPFGVATKDAYRWFDESAGTALEDVREERTRQPLFRNVPMINDLEGPVAARHSLIRQLKQRLTSLGALMAAMSGSGSTVFGVFTSSTAALRAARALKTEGARVVVSRFRGRVAHGNRFSRTGRRTA
jgi:4-diphosphocytidyl-2-C-methyl-D-erythritol kinase